jgi:hypothetical protein
VIVRVELVRELDGTWSVFAYDGVPLSDARGAAADPRELEAPPCGSLWEAAQVAAVLPDCANLAHPVTDDDTSDGTPRHVY